MKKQINFKILSYTLLLILFALCTEDDPIEFSLTTNCVPEKTGTVSPESGMFIEGTEIELKATANAEYIFKNWEGDVVGDENPITITMSKNKVITAVFEKLSYALSIQVQGQGHVKKDIIVNKSVSDYPAGTTVQLTAVPEDNWYFARWEGDLGGNENPILIEMDKSMTLTAVFIELSNDKTFVPDDNFEKTLIDLGYDDNMDDFVLTANIRQIKELDLSNQGIMDLTGIEGFEELNILVLSNNDLSSIDISQNRFLFTLICDNNELTNLNLSQNVPLRYVNATGNPLSCVHISPVQLWSGGFGPQGGWLAIDQGVVASVNCSVTEDDRIYVPGDAFEQALIDLGLDDVLDDYVKSINVINIYDLDLSGKNISDLTGIEGFEGLLLLDVSDNELTNVDISDITVFYDIDLRNNPLTCVQVSEWQMNSLGGGISFIWVDEGVEFSLDCE